MKKSFLIFAFLFAVITANAQFSKPSGAVVISPYTMWRTPADSGIHIYQGSTNLYNSFLMKWDTVKRKGYFTNYKALLYRLISDTIRLKGTATVYDLLSKKDLSDSTDADGYTRRDRLAMSLALKEDKSNKVTSISGASTDIEYPSAKLLYDKLVLKAPALSGTQNYVSKFTSATAIGNSLIYDNGTGVGIGTILPKGGLDVANGWLVTRNGNPYTWNISSISTQYITSTYGAAINNEANGDINIYTAPSGTAGNTATLTARVTVKNTGGVGVEVTPTEKFSIGTTVAGTSVGSANINFIYSPVAGYVNTISNIFDGVNTGRQMLFTLTNQSGTNTVTPLILYGTGNATAVTSLTTPTAFFTAGAIAGYTWQCTSTATGAGAWANVTGAVYKGEVDGDDGKSGGGTALIDGTGTAGNYYACNDAGTYDYGNPNGNSITLAIGDQLYYNGTIWLKIPGAGSYTLPIATASLGGVITNSNISVNAGTGGMTVLTNANLTGHITSTGNATILGSFTSANLSTALTDETGSGVAVFSASPALTGYPTVTAASSAQLALINTNTAGIAAYRFYENANSIGAIQGMGSNTGTRSNNIEIYNTTATGGITFHFSNDAPSIVFDPNGTTYFSGVISTVATGTSTDWNAKQAALVSGTSLKTVGGVNLLGSGDVGIIGSAYGGTGNGFTKFSGATTSEKTYTLPDANETFPAHGAANNVMLSNGTIWTSAALGTGAYATIANYRRNNDHDSLSTLQEKAYASLTGKPTLGTASAQDVGYFATAAQANATHTGDVTGATALTIGAGKVTLAMQANMATASFIGRNTAGTGVPEVLSMATAKTMLGLGTAAYTASTAYEVPLTFSTGLNRTGNTITNTITNNNQLTNGAGYLTSLGTALVDADFPNNGLMVRTSAGAYGNVTDNSSSWNTAYGWGNHASAGYITGTPWTTTFTNDGTITAEYFIAHNFTLTASDSTLKRNIKPFNLFDFEKAGKIDFKKYTLKADTTNRQHYGAMAQIVEKQFPEMVYTDLKTGKKTVSYEELLIVKFAAMEEEIRLLKEEIKLLKK